MHRRHFLAGALATATVATAGSFASTIDSNTRLEVKRGASAIAGSGPLQPMALGLVVKPADGADATLARVKAMGFTNCFFSIDGYLGRYSKSLAQELSGLIAKYELTVTTAEVVHPEPLVWDFAQGPATIGLVPRATRAARIDALKQTSDFAKLLGIPQIQTHCGFIPEDPADPLYAETVMAIREVAKHCAGNGQDFLMETGQETPTTMSRAIKDVGQPNLGVGLDTANLILYGKANPSDAVDILGPHIKSIHAKDGKWPTDPMKLGEEVPIGSGLVDFAQVFTKLRAAGYTGAVSIERETDGPQQIQDVKAEKVYLERILAKISNQPA